MLRYIACDDNFVYLVQDDPWVIKRADGEIGHLDHVVAHKLGTNKGLELSVEQGGLQSWAMQELLNAGVPLVDMPSDEWKKYVGEFVGQYLLHPEEPMDLCELLEKNEGHEQVQIPQANQDLITRLRIDMAENPHKYDMIQGEKYDNVVLRTRTSQICSNGGELRKLFSKGKEPTMARKHSPYADLIILGDETQVYCFGTSATKKARKGSRKRNLKRLTSVARFISFNYTPNANFILCSIGEGEQLEVKRDSFVYSTERRELMNVREGSWAPIDL